MDELPVDPRAQTQAILRLEAQVLAMRSMIALLVADNAMVLKGLKQYATMVEAIGLGSMLTDQQIIQMRDEIGSVLETVSLLHNALGIDPDKPKPASAD
jgi:hypothetical protein